MKALNYLLIVGALLVLGSCTFSKTTGAPKTPNVVFIYADDLGRGLLSSEGQQIIATPHIDKLSKAGVRFENAYGSMYCAPARASLLTGYHDCQTDKWKISNGGIYKAITTNDTVNHTMIQNALNAQYGEIPEDEVFLAEVFQQAGYVTGQVGKLDWGFATTHNRLKRHGWDYYFGYYDHVRCHGFYPPFLFENGHQVDIAGNTRADCGKTPEYDENGGYEKRWDMTGKKQYSQNLFLDKILTFLEDHQNEPFFLYHPTQLPHGPSAVPEIHPDFVDNPNLTEIEKTYASMVKMLDDHVGAIVNKLEELDLMDNTIIVFSSDNGHELYYPSEGKLPKPVKKNIYGEKIDNINVKYYSETAVDVFDGNDGMAGLKRSNWEGGVRVPLIYYWNGNIEGGKTINQLVANYDMMATFADLLDIQLPADKHSRSYLPHLMGEPESASRDFTVYASFMGPALVTNDGWKLRYFIQQDLFQLYYLPEDYKEENDLIADHEEKYIALKAKLIEACGGDLANGHFTGKTRVLPKASLN
ncbi:arylsulfatase [Marinoscillum furvescens]|uniref:Arylsulfatase A-like enzyme n=1 Tax=Marinoscillum furvescens DSM 4134 TaxID=1122208 RepID=A0A3D9L5C9_MARFU|nr:arylsulfatase [Marinoscillum furvescens]REE00150.1 arylsulfatase A-like enzyme [Marinoscillum furvescens DSM 4134]